MGYSHIPGRHAQAVDAFLSEHLVPYLNFHRPCFFPEIVTDAKGRQRRRYPRHLMDTPYEKLKALPEAASFLKPGLTFDDLDRVARAMTDNQAAEQLLKAREKLFSRFHTQRVA